MLGLTVVGTKKEKKREEKKRVCKDSWVGYCPFPSIGHDIVHCIVTQGVGACSRVATTRPHDMANMGHDTAPRHGQHGPRHGWPRARACGAWLAGESRYKCCIVAGVAFVSQYGQRYRLRYGAAAPYDTA